MNRRALLTGAGALVVTGAVGWAAVRWFSRPVETGPIYSGREDGVAVKGTDVVAYFTQGRAVPGRSEHRVEWRGADWLFANAEHAAAFEADPERYAPQYGGFCAYAAANGERAKVEPEAWSIVDGRLYLNYDLPIRDRWDAKQAEYIAAADREWPSIAKR